MAKATITLTKAIEETLPSSMKSNPNQHVNFVSFAQLQAAGHQASSASLSALWLSWCRQCKPVHRQMQKVQNSLQVCETKLKFSCIWLS